MVYMPRLNQDVSASESALSRYIPDDYIRERPRKNDEVTTSSKNRLGVFCVALSFPVTLSHYVKHCNSVTEAHVCCLTKGEHVFRPPPLFVSLQGTYWK